MKGIRRFRGSFRGTALVGVVLLVVVATLVAVACAGDEATPTPTKVDKVTLMLDWAHTPQHALWYGGYDQGFFDEEGIDLTIRDGQGSGTTVQMIDSEHADFGFADGGEMAQAIAQGMPVKMVAQTFRSGSLSVYGLKETGLNTPKDLEGKTICGMSDEEDMVEAFLAANGVDGSKVKFIAVSPPTKAPLIAEKKVDACTGWHRHSALYAIPGVMEPEQMFDMPFSVWDFNIVGHGIVVRTETLKANPDLVRRFVAAAVKSWEWGKNNPKEAMRAGYRNRPEENRDFELMVEVLKTDLELLYSKETEGWALGKMSDKDWQFTLDTLKNLGAIESVPNLEDIFTNDFLP